MEVAAAKAIGAGIAMIALGGVGIGMGQIFGSLIGGVARNPASRDRVFGLAILGFALTEAVALYALVIAFIILFV
jgi:F-type H+-transporting ATPase subunit c